MPSSRPRSQQDRAADLGHRLRKRRRELRLTQSQVAQQVPMSAANLSRIENGDQGPPSDEVLARLAAALQLPAVELLALVGRTASANAFEQRVLGELRAIREELRTGIERIERAVSER